MTNYTGLLSFDFLNKLGFFLKLVNNDIIFIISNTFVFRANSTICKNII